MINKIKQVFSDLYYSIFNNEKGASARKILGVSCFWTAFELAQKLEGNNRLYATYAFLGAGLLAFSIVTVANIIDLKNGKQPQS